MKEIKLLEQALNKANLKGAFTLVESLEVALSLRELNSRLISQEETIKNLTPVKESKSMSNTK